MQRERGWEGYMGGVGGWRERKKKRGRVERGKKVGKTQKLGG